MMGKQDVSTRPVLAPASRELTPRQEEVLELIARYIDQNHEAPSVSFLARRLGVHKTTVQAHLEAMCRKGWLSTPRPWLARHS